MVTIASLTFSITTVALQQASSQFGPRLLHNFMRDRGNKIVLGTFISSFTFCLLVLRSVNGTDSDRFVPHLSVTVGLASGLAGVGVLIYFIHHAAASLQAEYVIARVSAELDTAMDRLFPERLGDANETADEAELPDDFPSGAGLVPAAGNDYVQAIDLPALVRLAAAHGLVLKLDRRPGQFVIRGGALARAWPAARVNREVIEAVRRAFYLGPRRTLFQDAEFAVDQLVEVAVRALSPGINDPFTAMACVDRIGAALCELAGRRLPSPYRRDDKGRVRVVVEGDTAEGIVGAAFHQVRQASRGNAAVTLRLLETIATAAPAVRTPALRDALLEQAAIIYHGSQEALPAEVDRAVAAERYQAVISAFAVGTPAG
jgi:uncharacterized membrane protein